MIFPQQANLVRHLGALSQQLCVYANPERCDCKYGFEKLHSTGEATGCPEARAAMKIIEAMSQAEYNELTARIDAQEASSLISENKAP